ncbi:hypothetical protein STEG23_028784, partial [Scotinomys teguina]
ILIEKASISLPLEKAGVESFTQESSINTYCDYLLSIRSPDWQAKKLLGTSHLTFPQMLRLPMHRAMTSFDIDVSTYEWMHTMFVLLSLGYLIEDDII